jgi:hypothetical protein
MRTSTINFFETPQGHLHIYDIIDHNNVEYLDALLDLYRELFPQYISALPQIRERAFLPANADPRFIRHQWVVTWNGYPAGLVSFRFAIRQSLGICLSIAIRPAYRSLAWDKYRRLSDFLIQQMVRQLEMDALNSGYPAPLGLVVEIEMATSTTDPAWEKARLHLFDRYREYGFAPLPVTCHEPSFVRNPADTQSSAKNAPPMQLCMLPINDCAPPSQHKVLSDVIDALLVDHYGLPESHWIVKQARESIEKSGENHDERND